MNKISEKDMVEKFINYVIVKNNFAYKKEVPFEGTKIDLTYSSGKYIYGIEFKLNNFSKVICQAKRIKNLFNFVYVCILHTSKIEKKIEICKNENIGLVIFDYKNNNFKRIVSPKKNKIKIHLINKNNYLKDVNYER